MNHLKQRIERNGIRHDHIYTILDVSQAYFSQMITGRRKMSKERQEILNEYLTEIEKINKKYLV